MVTSKLLRRSEVQYDFRAFHHVLGVYVLIGRRELGG